MINYPLLNLYLQGSDLFNLLTSHPPGSAPTFVKRLRSTKIFCLNQPASVGIFPTSSVTNYSTVKHATSGGRWGHFGKQCAHSISLVRGCAPPTWHCMVNGPHATGNALSNVIITQHLYSHYSSFSFAVYAPH